MCLPLFSFSCAAVVKVDNDRSKFEFHGSPHLWDGKTIKKRIKGNSALYILEDEISPLHDSAPMEVDENQQEGVPSCSIDGMGDFRDNHGDQSTLQNHMSLAPAPGEDHPSTVCLWFNNGNMATSSQLQGFNVMPASTTCNIDTTVTIPGGHVETSSSDEGDSSAHVSSSSAYISDGDADPLEGKQLQTFKHCVH